MSRERTSPYPLDLPKRFRVTEERLRRIAADLDGVDGFETSFEDGAHRCDTIGDLVESMGDDSPQLWIRMSDVQDRSRRLVLVLTPYAPALTYFPDDVLVRGMALQIREILREDSTDQTDGVNVLFGDPPAQTDDGETEPVAARPTPPDSIGSHSYDLRPCAIYLEQLEAIAELFASEAGGATLKLDGSPFPLSDLRKREAPFKTVELSSNDPAITLTLRPMRGEGSVSRWGTNDYKTNSIMLRARVIAEKHLRLAGLYASSDASFAFPATVAAMVFVAGIVLSVALSQYLYFGLAWCLAAIIYIFGMMPAMLSGDGVKLRRRYRYETLIFRLKKLARNWVFWTLFVGIVAAVFTVLAYVLPR